MDTGKKIDVEIHLSIQYELSQLGNTGIIVLETCAPKLAKAKKKVNIGTAPSPFKMLLCKLHHHHSKYCCANGKITVCNSYSSGLHMWGRVGQGWCLIFLAYFINYRNSKYLIISVNRYFFLTWRQIKQANDTEEANNFHAATQKSVRTSGFRIRGDILMMGTAMQIQPINM